MYSDYIVQYGCQKCLIHTDDPNIWFQEKVKWEKNQVAANRVSNKQGKGTVKENNDIMLSQPNHNLNLIPLNCSWDIQAY